MQRDRFVQRAAVRRLPDRIVRQPRERDVRPERAAIGRQAEIPQCRHECVVQRDQRRLDAQLRDDQARLRQARPPREPLDGLQRQRMRGREPGQPRGQRIARAALDRAEKRERHVQVVGVRAPRAARDLQRVQRVARRRIGHQRDERTEPVAVHDQRAATPGAPTVSGAAAGRCGSGPCSPQTSFGSTRASSGIVLRVNTGSATPAARWRR